MLPASNRFSGCLILFIVFFFKAGAVLAAQSGDFTYSSNGSAITITDYTGSGGSVVIPDVIAELPVMAIGDYAFDGSVSVTSVTIPAGVTSIGWGAFGSCTGLTSMTISSGVTSIGAHAFASCTGLTSMTIPSSVTSIGSYAFASCMGLTSIAVDMANSFYSASGGVLFNKAQTTLILYPCGKSSGYTIPSTVTSIWSEAFYDCTSLTSVTIPSGVTSIGREAFHGCTSLTSVTIPSGVTNIEAYAFASCAGLTSVTIPSSVTSIRSGAFSYCAGLTSATFLGNAPTTFGNGTFGTGVFDYAAPGFSVYYYRGATGFTPGTWWGYPSVMLGIPSPEINVLNGKNLKAGKSTVTFGPVKAGRKKAITFTVKNTGTANLSNISAKLSGGNKTQFTIITKPATSLAAGMATKVTVTFKPSRSGARKTTLRISSSDADETPFDIKLTGTAKSKPGSL